MLPTVTANGSGELNKIHLSQSPSLLAVIGTLSKKDGDNDDDGKEQ